MQNIFIFSKKRFLSTSILCLGIFFSSFLQAQVSFSKGKIFRTNDTITAYIKEEGNEKMCRAISYKEDMSDRNTLTLLPKEIKGYALDEGSAYIKATLGFERNEPGSNEKKLKVDAYFLRQVETGAMNLYQLHADGISRLYVQRSGGPLKLLYYTLEKQSINRFTKDTTVVRTDTLTDFSLLPKEYEVDNYKLRFAHVTIFRQLIKDCPTVQVPPKLELKVQTVASLVREYNLCRSPKIVERKINPNRPPLFQTKLQGAYSIPTFLFIHRVQRGFGLVYLFDEGKIVNKKTSGYQASLGIGLPRISRQLYLNYTYHHQNTAFRLTEASFETRRVVDEDVNYNVSEHSVVASYYLTKGKRFSPFIAVGFASYSGSGTQTKYFDNPQIIPEITFSYKQPLAFVGADYYFNKHFYLHTDFAVIRFDRLSFGAGVKF
jgi:hypothetical protein